MSRSWLSISLVVGALILGAITGLYSGAWVLNLFPVSKLLIQLIKASATPLVFFAVLEAVLQHRIATRDFSKLLVVVLLNASIAIALGITIANLFQPGENLKFLHNDHSAKALAVPDLGALLQKQVPSSFVQPFADNDILATVVLALLLAVAWRRIAKQNSVAAPLLAQGSAWVSIARELSELILTWVVKLVPIAVFVASAKITHEHGLAPFKGLSQYVALCLLGMLLHALITYSAWIVLFARLSWLKFWRHAAHPILYAIGVNSSLVALPLTLQALDKLGVSRRASTLSACIGTNLNNDGIILYEGFTLLALAQAFGIHMSLGSQVIAALYCIIAAMGVAGIPEAGVVALTLVLSNFGLPTEALAVLLSVDWLIARSRSALNVSADMVGAVILQRWIGMPKTGSGQLATEKA